jgi:hypothetical protein
MALRNMRIPRKAWIIAPLSLLGVLLTYLAITYSNWNSKLSVGQKVDEFNGVPVFYNGSVNNY